MKADAFAHVLHTDVIAKLARGAALARGRAYAAEGRVKDLKKTASHLTGTVTGGAPYSVSIWVKGDGLGYKCSCPMGDDGHFCKHCVAVALTWLEGKGVITPKELDAAVPARPERPMRVSFDSTVMTWVEYDAPGSTLQIAFRTGAIYQYFDVPKPIFRAFLEAQSKGRFFQERIERVYRNERISRG